VLKEAHETKLTVHPRSTKMYKDLKGYYWWPKMKREIAEFVTKCPVCQQVKVEHQKPVGNLQPLPIPEWKWEDITMNFVMGLPRNKKGNDAILVIMDRLTKSALFLPMKMTNSVDKLARLYISKVIRLHGVLVSIVSDWDPRFTSRLWPSVQQAIGSNMRLSVAFRPQTDGQLERTIQTLEDLLRTCILDFRGHYEVHLPLVEFTYNNSHQTTIGMAPYEVYMGEGVAPQCVGMKWEKKNSWA